MAWDGKYRRASDHGKESPEAIWARVDERVKNLLLEATDFKKELSEHKKDDEIKFGLVNRNIYTASGAVMLAGFIITVLATVYSINHH